MITVRSAEVDHLGVVDAVTQPAQERRLACSARRHDENTGFTEAALKTRREWILPVVSPESHNARLAHNRPPR